MNLTCFLDPGGCINSAIATWIAWFPFGIEGVKAAAWMIVGAILGRLGVAAVVALGIALKVANVKSVPTSEQYPHPDEKPAPKPKKGLWK
jgi:hypothetical protein